MPGWMVPGVVASLVVAGLAGAPAYAGSCVTLSIDRTSIAEIAGKRVCGNPEVLIFDTEGPGSVVLPALDSSVTYSALSTAAEVPEFTVYRSSNGEIAGLSHTSTAETISGSESFIESVDRPDGLSPAATNPKCDNFSYALTGSKWASTVRWYYKTPSFGGQARVAGAFTAMANGIGACGQSKPNSAAHTYVGTTTSSANLTQTSCGISDLKSVIDSGGLTGTTLAVTCTWKSAGEITAGHIRVDSSSRSWYTAASATDCSGSNTYDLQGVATHEIGHLYGLGHVAQGTGQVMEPTSDACETGQRTLGNGDLAGMKAIYP